jgi:hypothetical protein
MGVGQRYKSYNYEKVKDTILKRIVSFKDLFGFSDFAYLCIGEKR